MNPLEFINQIKDMYNDQDPRSMAQGSRNTYSQGQLVTPSVDGSRPGYAGEEETATYKYEDSRLRYNKKTKKWEMIAGRDQELYIQEPGETKPQFKKRVKKVGIDRRTKAFDLQSKQRKTSQNYINNWTKDWLDNNLKNYGVRDFDKAMTAMGKDWQANIKNLDLPKGMTLSLSRGEFNLPNVTTTRVGKAGKKPFTYEGFNLHTMFENPKEPGKYMAQWKKMFMKNKIRTTPGLKKDILEYFKFINKDKRGKVWRQEGTVKAFKDIMNKDVIYLMSPDSGITGHGKESLFNSFDDAFNKEYNKYAKKINLGSNWKEAAAKIEKQLGYKPGHILKSMSKERKALQKLFNLKELPHELRYSLEHGQGIAAAAKTNNPVIMQRAMDDLIGTTVRQNKALGWGGFEATRNALMRDIMAGNNVTDNIKSLNELSRGAYKDFGLKGKMYSMKDGQLTSKPITTAFTQEERFKQYFKEIDKTKEGRAAIKKQHGSLKNLLTKLCPKGQASGGRIGFADGPATVKCGSKRLEQIILRGGAKEGEQELAEKILKAGRGLRGMFSLSGMFGPAALAFTAATEAGFVGYDMLSKGKTFREAVGESVFNYALGKDYQIDPQKERDKRLRGIGGGPPSQAFRAMSEKEMGKIAAYESALSDIDELENIFNKDAIAKQKLQQAKKFYPAVVDKRKKEADAVRADIRDLTKTGTEQRLMNVDYEAGAKALKKAQDLITIDQLTSSGPKIVGKALPITEESRQDAIAKARGMDLALKNANPGVLFARENRYMYPFGFASGGRAGYMGGGIAAIRKPHAIPPKRQGLRSIMINVNDD